MPLRLLLSVLALAGVSFGSSEPPPGIDVIRGPYLQRGTPTSVVVRWRTNLPVPSRVWYGTSPDNLSSSVDDSDFSIEHKLTITGLTPATKYYYAIGSAFVQLAGGDDEHFFVTQPLAGEPQPTRVWVLGDSGTASENAAAVRDAYYGFTGATHTDAWLMLGDNAYPEGTDDEYQDAVFDMYPEMLRKSVLWPARGNHEFYGFVYYNLFSLPQSGQAGGVPSGTEAYYSFDQANVHFICLDSFASSPLIGDAMYNWLEADLAATDQDWIVAYWHHPPYTKGSHDSDIEIPLILMRTNIIPLLESGGVDLVLSGHSHSYERSMLIDGHYGFSDSFDPGFHAVDMGDGRALGDGAYRKEPGPHAGTIYCVAGSSGKASTSVDLDHPIMVHSNAAMGSVVIDVDGGRMDVRFLRDTGVVEDWFTLLQEPYFGSYCVATESSQGCEARVEFTGEPSVTSSAPFEIAANDVVNGQPGILFYGFSPAQIPFGDGFVCAGGQLVRTDPQNSGGAAPCEGRFEVDFNAYVQAQPNPSAFAGAEVFCQFWYRDPESAAGTGLSDALQFTVGP